MAVVKEGLEEYKKARQVQKSEASVRISTGIEANRSIWVKPDEGFVKINWDASLDVNKMMMGMGMGIIIRNEVGDTMVAAYDNRNMVKKSDIAECLHYGKHWRFATILIFRG